MDFEKAVEFMKKKHGGQKRKQGTPYCTHPLAVAILLIEIGFPFEYQIAGLFHDLIEYTDATYEEIIALSSEEVAEVVRLLSKTKGYVMSEYVGNIKLNEMAKMVKLADRIHNLSESPNASHKFQAKYIKETKAWYVGLAEGTVFEEDLNRELNNLIRVYEEDGIDR